MLIIVSKYLIPKGYRGLTIFPFVVLGSKSDLHDKVLLNHEKIHIRQQLELLIVPFFVWYGLEFLIRLAILRNGKDAYRAICFEKEAFGNEKKLSYLSNKKFFSFLNYYSF
jgi:hypothetical protein